VFTLIRAQLHKSGYPCLGYSKHEFSCIPVAAVHNDMSLVRVRFALVRVISAQVLLLGNLYK